MSLPGPDLQIELLHRLIRVVADSTTVEGLLHEAIEILEQALGDERFAVVVRDAGATRLSWCRGLSEGVRAEFERDRPWPHCETAAPLILRSLLGDDHPFDVEFAEAVVAAGAQSLLRLPIWCRGSALGEIVVLGTTADGWDDRSVAFGMQVATLVGGALERQSAVWTARSAREIADQVPVGVLVERAGGAITYCNAEFCRLFGLSSPAAVIGRSVAEVVEDVMVLVDRKGFCKRAVGLTRAGVPNLSVSIPVVGNRTFEQSFVPVVAGGDPVRRLWTYTDVTDRRRFQERLAHIEKMESLATLAGGVAHDFNNLLTTIMGHLDLLRVETSGGTPARAHVDNLLQVSEHAAGLNKQLLAFSNPTSPTLSEIDLADLVSDSVAMLRRLMPRDVAVEFHQKTNESVVLGDPTRLHQVLNNLSVNARDAMPDGGVLSIELESARFEGRPAVLLRVRDDGTGMDDDTRRRAFEPLFTTKEPGKGTGLGLAACYGVIDGMGGELSVQTRLGEGSEFRVLLPLQVESTESVEWATQVGEDGAQVLLVDDEVHVRSVLRNCLVANGFGVAACASGEEALAALEERTFDVVVTDVTMDGMNGFELAQRIREDHAGLPILLMTGFVDAVIEEPLDLPLIEKPFLPRELVYRIRAELVAARDHS